MKITPFTKMFAATRDGVVNVETRLPETTRGVVRHWECLDLDYKDEVFGKARFISVRPKHLFTEEEPARKAVFRLKLTTEEE